MGRGLSCATMRLPLELSAPETVGVGDAENDLAFLALWWSSSTSCSPPIRGAWPRLSTCVPDAVAPHLLWTSRVRATGLGDGRPGRIAANLLLRLERDAERRPAERPELTGPRGCYPKPDLRWLGVQRRRGPDHLRRGWNIEPGAAKSDPATYHKCFNQNVLRERVRGSPQLRVGRTE